MEAPAPQPDVPEPHGQGHPPHAHPGQVRPHRRERGRDAFPGTFSRFIYFLLLLKTLYYKLLKIYFFIFFS